MDIASRIENINNNLKNAYDSIEGLGIDIGEKNRNLENLSIIFDEIYEEQPKVTGEGTNIVLDNTKKGRIKSTLNGDLSQETTTGKNSFDILEVTQFGNCSLNNGIITTSTLTDGFKNVTMVFPQKTFVSGHTYYLSADIRLKSGTGAVSKINDYIADWSIVSKPTVSNQFQRYVYKKTFSSDTDYNHLLFQFIVNEGDEAVFEIKDIMISESEDDSYEPYTNGASPNPDYPQEIKVVTGDQNVKIHGKNFFDIGNANIVHLYSDVNNNLVQSGEVTTIYIPCEPNTLYTIQKSATGTNNRFCVFTTDVIPSSGNKTLNYVGTRAGADNHTNYTILTPLNAKYLCVFIAAANTTPSINDLLSTIQIEKDSTATIYEQYQGATYPLSLSSLELAQIGDYKDYIYRENGKWYKYGAIGKVVLNGSENWTSAIDGSLIRYFLNELPNQPMANKIPISNYFRGAIGYDKIFANGFITNTPALKLSFCVRSITSTPDFKIWLSTHNTIVYYILETPDIIEITDTTLISQLNNLYNAKSYNDTTIITIDGDLPSVLNVSALEKDS